MNMNGIFKSGIFAPTLVLASGGHGVTPVAAG